MHWLAPSGEHLGDGVHDLGGLDTDGAVVAFGALGDRLTALAAPRGRGTRFLALDTLKDVADGLAGHEAEDGL